MIIQSAEPLFQWIWQSMIKNNGPISSSLLCWEQKVENIFALLYGKYIRCISETTPRLQWLLNLYYAGEKLIYRLGK